MKRWNRFLCWLLGHSWEVEIYPDNWATLLIPFEGKRTCRRCGQVEMIHKAPPLGFNCRCHRYSSYEIRPPKDDRVNLNPYPF